MEDKVTKAKELFGDFSGHLLDQEYECDLSKLTDDDNNVIFAFGRLDAIETEDGDFLEWGANEAPLICSSHDGKQLFIIGGDYEIEEFEPVGIYAVEYSTYRDYNFEQYRHEFAESDLPVLHYEPDGELFVDGGLYTFTDAGIENK